MKLPASLCTLSRFSPERRRFIAALAERSVLAGLGFAAGPSGGLRAMPLPQAAQSARPPVHDVVVIGAGAAGLSRP